MDEQLHDLKKGVYFTYSDEDNPYDKCWDTAIFRVDRIVYSKNDEVRKIVLTLVESSEYFRESTGFKLGQKWTLPLSHMSNHEDLVILKGWGTPLWKTLNSSN